LDNTSVLNGFDPKAYLTAMITRTTDRLTNRAEEELQPCRIPDSAASDRKTPANAALHSNLRRTVQCQLWTAHTVAWGCPSGRPIGGRRVLSVAKSPSSSIHQTPTLT